MRLLALCICKTPTDKRSINHKLYNMKVEPTLENTLELVVKQNNFMSVLDGTKKDQCKEIKFDTYLEYLDHQGESVAYNPDLVVEDPESILTYNGGVYPFIPIEYKFISLSTSDADIKKTLLVEVTAISFEIMIDNKGKEIRFDYDEDDGIEYTYLGDNARWRVKYTLGTIIKSK